MAELSDAAEKASEAATLGAEAVEEVVELAHDHIKWLWGGLISGIAAGLGVGYLGTRRYLEVKYEKIAEKEISEMRVHFRERMVAREKKPDLVDLNKKVEDLGYKDPPAPGEPNVQADPNLAETPTSITRNVFSDQAPSDGWDYEVEKASRVEGGTYIIHKDEFGETDNNEVSLSYYGGDDILCDQDDHIIETPFQLVGDCLSHFGHGSNDRNVVYIRNEALDVDLEVVKSDKTYAEEVHGFKHEDPPRRKTPRRPE